MLHDGIHSYRLSGPKEYTLVEKSPKFYQEILNKGHTFQ